MPVPRRAMVSQSWRRPVERSPWNVMSGEYAKAAHLTAEWIPPRRQLVHCTVLHPIVAR